MDAILLSSLAGNSQRLDGGAMFGNAPRALWSRSCPPDAENRIPLCTRCLLIETGDRRVLLEAGIGAFFPPLLRARYGVKEEEHVLLRSLAELGLAVDDISDVVLSHLHFDHAGGLLSAYSEGAPPRLCFPRARYFVSEAALERARRPHLRDRASFIPELLPLLDASGRLCVIEGAEDGRLPGLRFHRSEGHTPGLLLTELQGASGVICFMSDMVPGTPWVHLPMTMGYDRYPERLIDEKEALLADLSERAAWLFYTHDVEFALSRVARGEDGRMRPTDLRSAIRRWAL